MDRVFRTQLNRTTIFTTIEGLLGHRQLPLWLALFAAGLTLPAMNQSWAADDLIHRQILLSYPLEMTLKELFVFAKPEMNTALMDLGLFPWWTAENLRVAFFRPVAAFTHWIDYQLWPDSASLMYLQNIGWYCLLCVATTVLYRHFFPKEQFSVWVSGIASLLFATNVVHLGAVTWIASRNTIISTLFGVLSLLAFVRQGPSKRWHTTIIAPTFLLIGLLSGEGAIAICAYLFAYSLFLDRRTITDRIIALTPIVLVILLWRWVYQLLGYGSVASGFYIDPAENPLRFAMAVGERGPILLASQWLGQVPLFYNVLSIPAMYVAWIVSIAILILLGVLLFPLFQHHSVARFWGTGMILSVVPACSIRMLSGRLLFFVALGVMALLAHIATSVLDITAARPLERGDNKHAQKRPFFYRRSAVRLVLMIHLVLSIAFLPFIVTASSRTQQLIDQVTAVNRISAETETQGIIIVNAPSPFNFIYFSTPSFSTPNQPPPQSARTRIRVLAPGASGVWITRLDSDTITVRPEGGFLSRSDDPIDGSINSSNSPVAHQAYIYQHLASFFRDSSRSLQVGEQVQLSDLNIEVVETSERSLSTEARMDFAKRLEDTQLNWLQWDWAKNEYVPFPLPEINETVWIAGPLTSQSGRQR